MDVERPDVKDFSPSRGEWISDDSPTVSYEASDPTSSIKSTWIKVQKMDGGFSRAANSSSIGLSDIPDGDYRAYYRVEDEAGNVAGKANWMFSVDTQKDWDSDPEVSPSSKVFRAEPGETRFTVTLDPGNEPEGVKVQCKLARTWVPEDPEVRKFQDERQFNCDFNTGSYRGLTKDLQVRITDRAGNSETYNMGEYTFDFKPPEVKSLETVVGVFNQDFTVNYEVADPTDYGSSTGVKKLHYQIDDDDRDLTQGTNASVSGGSGSFRVEVSNLTSGNYTLHVWAMDQAGRWSNYATLDFDYRPYAEPHATVKVQDRKEITSGETGSVKVNVTNTGKLLIEGMKLNVGGDLYNRSLSVGSLKPGRSEVLNVSLPTEPRDMGRHTVTFSTESPDVSTSMDLIVRANEEQRKKIKQKYQKWRSRYKRLHTNVSELQQAIGGSWERQLEGNFSGFNETIQQATEAKITGNYYKVSNALQGIREKYAQAREAFNTVQEKYRSAQTTHMVLTLFLVSFGVVGIVAGYVYFSDDYYLDLDALTGHEAVRSLRESDYGELAAAKLGSAAERISEFIEEEEEEAESGFQGFT